MITRMEETTKEEIVKEEITTMMEGEEEMTMGLTLILKRACVSLITKSRMERNKTVKVFKNRVS